MTNYACPGVPQELQRAVGVQEFTWSLFGDSILCRAEDRTCDSLRPADVLWKCRVGTHGQAALAGGYCNRFAGCLTIASSVTAETGSPVAETEMLVPSLDAEQSASVMVLFAGMGARFSAPEELVCA